MRNKIFLLTQINANLTQIFADVIARSPAVGGATKQSPEIASPSLRSGSQRRLRLSACNLRLSAFTKGFTLIEIIITIVIWSILIIPLAFMVKEHIIGTATAADIAVAYNLARLELSKVNNLSYSDATLADGYNNTTTDYEGYKYDLNRSVNYVPGSSNNLKMVTVTVYESGITRQLANLITYVANVSVGAGSGGGASSGGGQSDFLVISGGTASANRLHSVDMQNTSTTDAITVSQVTVSWTNLKEDKPASLTQIEMDGVIRWSGTQPTSGGTTALTTPFTLSANTTYDNTGIFTFSENINSVTITFIMSDGSYSSAIIWYRTT